jgi:hypothetical protein
VLLEDAELREIQRTARAKRMTTAEWVRQSLRAARQEGVGSDPYSKLEAVRKAMTHSFPTGDIAQLLAEIEGGYTGEHSSRDAE